MDRIKCSEGCGQNWADKGNEAKCKCPCHSPSPEVAFRPDAVLHVWNWRLGQMVDIATHNFVERMAKR